MQNRSPVNPLFSLLYQGLVGLYLLTVGLYLISFGLHGTNMFGAIDALIPIERVMLGVLGFVSLGLSIPVNWRFVKKYIEVIKK